MKLRRQNRLTDLWRDHVAQFLEQVSDRSTIITVTHTELLEEGKVVKAFITVIPEEREVSSLEFANRKVGQLRAFVAEESKTEFVPRFTFVIDKGEKNRQRIDEIERTL